MRQSSLTKGYIESLWLKITNNYCNRYNYCFRVPGCNVTPHFCRIESFNEAFYRQFHIIVCGLDSVVARRWINGMILSLLNFEEDGRL